MIIDSKNKKLNIREIFSYRDLLWTLVYRDYKVRYAQTVLGFLWAFIQPLVTLIIFTFIFGKAVKVNTQQIPYPLFALSGMLAWNYFAYVLNQAGNSIISSHSLITKIYFPRLIIPLSKAFNGFIEFIVSLLFLAVLMIYYQICPGIQLMYLPFFILILIISSLAMGIWFSAITIRYRDLQQVIPFVVQVGMYLTPVVYPSALVPAKYRYLYFLNPMSGIVEAFRWSILGTTSLPNSVILISISFSVGIFLFISGIYYFNRIENKIADIL